ncbi:hypothetical protein Btru_012762 [Bulinus truncatus]|nr:hypothetical protein Btru_012762 [Bulinus truncatus]
MEEDFEGEGFFSRLWRWLFGGSPRKSISSSLPDTCQELPPKKLTYARGQSMEFDPVVLESIKSVSAVCGGPYLFTPLRRDQYVKRTTTTWVGCSTWLKFTVVAITTLGVATWLKFTVVAITTLGVAATWLKFSVVAITTFQQSKYVLVTEDSVEQIDKVAADMTWLWNMSTPKLVLTLISSEQYFKPWKRQQELEDFQDGLMKVGYQFSIK